MPDFKKMSLIPLAIAFSAILTGCELPESSTADLWYEPGTTYEALSAGPFGSEDILFSSVYTESNSYHDYDEYLSAQSVTFSVSDEYDTISAHCAVTRQVTDQFFPASFYAVETLATCSMLSYATGERWEFSGYSLGDQPLTSDTGGELSQIRFHFDPEIDSYVVAGPMENEWNYDIAADSIEWWYSATDDLTVATTIFGLYLFENKLLQDTSALIDASTRQRASTGNAVMI